MVSGTIHSTCRANADDFPNPRSAPPRKGLAAGQRQLPLPKTQLTLGSADLAMATYSSRAWAPTVASAFPECQNRPVISGMASNRAQVHTLFSRRSPPYVRSGGLPPFGRLWPSPTSFDAARLRSLLAIQPRAAVAPALQAALRKNATRVPDWHHAAR